MAEPQDQKAKKARTTGPKGPSRLALAGVIILVLAAAGGWTAFAFTRFMPESVLPPATATAGPATRPVQTNPPAGQTSTRATSSPVISGSSQNSKPLAYGVVISKVLNVREAPTTASAIIRPLQIGDIVELTRRNGGWYQTTDGRWVSAVFLEVRLTRAEAESYAREIKSQS
jgi:uncharacterized protein YgiM (DUF1202 family)